MTALVAGVDLSLVSTGIALSTGQLHRVTSKGFRGDTLTDRRGRLVRIVDQIITIVDGARLVLVEGPSYASKGSGTHDRAGLWWLVVDALHHEDITVVEIPPSCRMKFGAGKGNASKDLVLAETVRRYPSWDVNGNDVADALVLCSMGCDRLGHPLADLPQAFRAALANVEWPTMPAAVAS